MIKFGVVNARIQRGESLEDSILRLTNTKTGPRFCRACGNQKYAKVRNRRQEWDKKIKFAKSMSLEDRTRKAGRTKILSEVVPVEPDHMQVTTTGIEESSTNAEADGKVNLMGLMGALRPFLEKIARDRWGSESSDTTVAGSGDGIDTSRARVDCLQGNIQAMNDYRNHINNISDGLFEAIWKTGF